MTFSIPKKSKAITVLAKYEVARSVIVIRGTYKKKTEQTIK